MSQKLLVQVVGDTSSFRRGLSESSTAAKSFEGQIKTSTSHVRSHILGMGAAFLGVGGVVEGLKATVSAAVQLDQATSQMNAQIKANHESIRAYSGQIQIMNQQMERVGYTNTQSEEAFSRLSRAAGNSGVALKYMGLTADLAASKHVALSAAALLVGKVIQGSTSALNRYGIIIPKGTSATDALRIAQEKLAGQAKAMAKPTEVFSTMLTDFEAKIGKVLLPTLDKLMARFETWFAKSENQKKVTDAVREALHTLEVVLSALKDVFDRIWPVIVKVKNLFGDWKPLIVGAGIALVALGMLSPWTALGLGAVYVITHWQKVKAWFEDFWARMKAGFTILWDALKLYAYQAALAMVEPFSHLPSFLGGWARDAKKNLEDGLGKIQDDMKRNENVITAGWGQAGKQAGNAWADALVGTIKGRDVSSATRIPGSSGVAAGTHDVTGGRAPSVGGGQRLGFAQIRSLWLQAGGAPQVANTMAAIALAESGGRVSALNANAATGDYSAGLWQTNYFGSMRAGRTRAYGTPETLRSNPLAAARSAVGIYGSQGLGAWTTYTSGAYASHLPRAALASATSGPLPGDQIAADKAAKQASAAASKAATQASAAASKAAAAAYKSWRDHYFIPLDNQYKSDLLISDEGRRLNKLEALHAKLAIDLKHAKGKEHQDIFNEETKIEAKIQALKVKAHNAQLALTRKAHDAYVKSLNDNLAAAQTSLGRQQTVFERGWSRIVGQLTGRLQGKYAAATPEEQARDAFQAQLDAAQKAADMAAAQGDLISAQASGDPAAVQAAQKRLDDIQNQQHLADLQDAADKARAVQNAAGDTALQNLNDWLDDQKTALQSGGETWDQFWQGAFSDAPSKYAPNAVTALQGIIDQQRTIVGLQQQIDGSSGSGGGSALSAGGGLVSGLGGAAGFQLLNPPHFASGGLVPGMIGEPMLAVVHGGERVLTPAQQVGGDIYTTVILDGQVVGRSVQKWAARDVRSGGSGVPGR